MHMKAHPCQCHHSSLPREQGIRSPGKQPAARNDFCTKLLVTLKYSVYAWCCRFLQGNLNTMTGVRWSELRLHGENSSTRAFYSACEWDVHARIQTLHNVNSNAWLWGCARSAPQVSSHLNVHCCGKLSSSSSCQRETRDSFALLGFGIGSLRHRIETLYNVLIVHRPEN